MTTHCDLRAIRATLFVACALALLPVRAEDDIANRPYRTYAATPAIVAGPILLDVSDTTATFVWMTDADSDAYVELGEGEGAFDRKVYAEVDGMASVGTMHRVVVDGLKPGTRYRYRTGSRRVVAIKPYWPDRGGSTESTTQAFTTLDPNRERTRFAVITDTHDDRARTLELLDIANTEHAEFVVHDGDSLDYVNTELQLRDGFIAPMAEGLRGQLPMLYARGNHETRGAFARELAPFLRAHEGGYSFVRRQGPVQLFVVDTGEDKPDETNVYAGLNTMRSYRARELERFRAALAQPSSAAAFRIVLAHQPDWGWTGLPVSAWSQPANAGGIDLMIAGHEHVHEWRKAGTGGNDFPTLVVGQDQVALVDADTREIKIRLLDRAGKLLRTYTVPRRK